MKISNILTVCLFFLIGATQTMRAEFFDAMSILSEPLDVQENTLIEEDSQFGFIVNKNKKNAKIKTMVHYKLDEPNSTIDNIKYKKYAVQTFNKKGNLLSEENFRRKTRTEYLYNKHGLLTEQKSYAENFKTPQSEVYTKYDSKGRKIESTVIEDQTTLRTIYSYDKDGRQLSETTYSGDKIVAADSTIYKNGNMIYLSNLYSLDGQHTNISRDYFEYDSNNNQVMQRAYNNDALKLIKFSDFNANGKPLNEYEISTVQTPISEYEKCSKIAFIYDEQGLLQSKRAYNLKTNGLASFNGDRASIVFTDTTLMAEVHYKYNDKGNCVERGMYKDGVLQMKYQYNESGKIISVYSYPEYKEQYLYDANGNLVEKTVEKNNGYRKTKTYHKYKYDADGNNTEVMEGTEGYTSYQALNITFDKYGNVTEVRITESDSNKMKHNSAVTDKIEYTYY